METQPFLTSVAAQIANLRAWCVLLLLGTLSRLLWMVSNRYEIQAHTPLVDWLTVFWTGLRFDCVSMSYVMLPVVLLSSLLVFAPEYACWVRRFRTIWLSMCVMLVSVLAFANVAYYQVFKDVFNEFLFACFDGNATSVMASAVSDYGLIPKLSFCAILSILVMLVYYRWIDRPVVIPSIWKQRLTSRFMPTAVTLIVLTFVGVAVRGSVGSRPLRAVDSGVTSCRVLNLGALSPLYNLRTAWMEHREAENYFDDDRLVPHRELVSEARTIAELIGTSSPTSQGCAPASFDFTSWQRTATGPPNIAPRHVFVLFMESYDSWPFLDPYRELHLVENGKRLGRAGHHLRTFLPGANSSLLSGLVTLQGLFETHRGRQQRLPTSLVQVFNQLGYRTRCINSFSSEWGDAQRIAVEQGFDETYYTADIKPGGETSTLEVHDRTLFEFTSEELSYDQPTFSFVRTSSYHTPYVIDVASEGCAVGPFPEHIRQAGMHDEEALRYAYGHLKYSDKMMGEFVDRMIARYPDSLFVITGDHYGRGFMQPRVPVYEHSSVPLILYGPNVLKGTELPEQMAGSHLDLAATLAELCAPAGFRYVSLGKSVLKPCPSAAGVGKNYVIFPHAIVSLTGQVECDSLPWKPDSLSEDEKKDTIARARRLHNAYHGVSYMLARHSLQSPESRSRVKQANETEIAETLSGRADPEEGRVLGIR